jgi:hypothetical protein
MQTTPGQKVVYPGSPPATQPPPLDGKLCIQGLLQQPSAHPWTESCVPGSPPATQPPPLDGKLCIQDLLQPPSPTPGRKVVYPGSPPATQRPPLDRKLCIQDLLQPPSPHPWTESCVSRISSSHLAPTPGRVPHVRRRLTWAEKDRAKPHRTFSARQMKAFEEAPIFGPR